MNDYKLTITMDIRRGHYNKSYENTSAIVPNVPIE